MKGFAEKWKDLPEYILGITKEIWEDRGIDTLNHYYTKDIPMRFPEGISIGNQNTINGTLATLSEFPDRQLTGEDVIWSGDDETGFLDRLRKGEITLYQHEDENKYKGILRPVSINANTTGGIVDIKGKSSYPWDLIKIIISNGGTFTAGVENTTVKFNTFIGNENGLKLEQMAINEIIDGYWQLIGHNMYVRFSPGLYTTSDEWELEVSGELDQRLTAIKTVRTIRQ